jgi:hypothetical protein
MNQETHLVEDQRGGPHCPCGRHRLRYVGVNGALTLDLEHATFSFGGRTVPGAAVADFLTPLLCPPDADTGRLTHEQADVLGLARPHVLHVPDRDLAAVALDLLASLAHKLTGETPAVPLPLSDGRTSPPQPLTAPRVLWLRGEAEDPGVVQGAPAARRSGRPGRPCDTAAPPS